METHIYDEKNGLSYTLHGDYYLPDLVLNEEEPIYGKYGMLRKQFLKEHRLAKYQYLLLTGKLTEHLNQIDQESREQVEMLMEQMAEKQGVTEELKVQNRTKWVMPVQLFVSVTRFIVQYRITVLQNFWKAHCFINSLRLGSTFSPPFSLESWWCFPLFAGQYCLLKKTPKIFGFFSKNFLSSKIRLSEKPGQTYRYCKRYSDD